MYKVVTEDMGSLGLRKNPNTMWFRMNKWVLEPQPQEGKQDIGGIWCCVKLSAARALKKYFENRYGRARIFECEIGIILYENSYRTKTDRIKLINEII
jgi:hypothetical protein